VILPEVGLEGQKKIRAASVLCIGAGGLGSPALLYLAAAGLGRLGIIDFDRVELSNLQRQVIYRTEDVGASKARTAANRIAALNPQVGIEAYEEQFNAKNALEIIEPYDVVIDGTDNFPTRYLANDACVMLKKPNVYGSIFRFEGQASLFAPHLGGPCYRCLYPEPPPAGLVPSCAEGGVLGVLPGIIGTIQATEALKLILGTGTTLLNRLLLFDALEMRFRELKLRRDPQCALCGERPTIKKLTVYEGCCISPPSSQTPMHRDEVTVQDMKQALDDPRKGIKVIDVREPDEHTLAHVEGVPLLPLSQLLQRFRELDPDQPYYLHCKAGGRSMKALEFLRQQGFKNIKSVKGGIDAWSDQIDPTVPKY
jgi:sulfur-carrier protein adenylyltransferase/sulfurtransferase